MENAPGAAQTAPESPQDSPKGPREASKPSWPPGPLRSRQRTQEAIKSAEQKEDEVRAKLEEDTNAAERQAEEADNAVAGQAGCPGSDTAAQVHSAEGLLAKSAAEGGDDMMQLKIDLETAKTKKSVAEQDLKMIPVLQDSMSHIGIQGNASLPGISCKLVYLKCRWRPRLVL